MIIKTTRDGFIRDGLMPSAKIIGYNVKIIKFNLFEHKISFTCKNMYFHISIYSKY